MTIKALHKEFPQVKYLELKYFFYFYFYLNTKNKVWLENDLNSKKGFVIDIKFYLLKKYE